MDKTITLDLGVILDPLSKISVADYIFLSLVKDERYNLASELFNILTVDIKLLQDCGYIKILGDKIESIEIREKGLELFRDNISIDDLATKYRDLFPVGVKTGGIPVRSSLVDIKEKLKKFKQKYKYPSDIILKATAAYVERLREQDFAYMKTAGYFILKGNESQLASECETFEENVSTPFVPFIASNKNEML